MKMEHEKMRGFAAFYAESEVSFPKNAAVIDDGLEYPPQILVFCNFLSCPFSTQGT